MDIKGKIKNQYTVTIIIGLSIISSIIIYAVVVEIIKYQNTPFHGFSLSPLNPVIHYAILGGGILPVILLNYVKDLLYSSSVSQSIEVTLNKLKYFSMIMFALCEIPVLCGFVLFLLWGIYFDFYILLGLSLILEYRFFPRLSKWEDIIMDNFGSAPTAPPAR